MGPERHSLGLLACLSIALCLPWGCRGHRALLQAGATGGAPSSPLPPPVASCSFNVSDVVEALNNPNCPLVGTPGIPSALATLFVPDDAFGAALSCGSSAHDPTALPSLSPIAYGAEGAFAINVWFKPTNLSTSTAQFLYSHVPLSKQQAGNSSSTSASKTITANLQAADRHPTGRLPSVLVTRRTTATNNNTSSATAAPTNSSADMASVFFANQVQLFLPASTDPAHGVVRTLVRDSDDLTLGPTFLDSDGMVNNLDGVRNDPGNLQIQEGQWHMLTVSTLSTGIEGYAIFLDGKEVARMQGTIRRAALQDPSAPILSPQEQQKQSLWAPKVTGGGPLDFGGSPVQLCIGADLLPESRFLGRLSHFSLYNASLTPSHVASLFSLGLSRMTPKARQAILAATTSSSADPSATSTSSSSPSSSASADAPPVTAAVTDAVPSPMPAPVGFLAMFQTPEQLAELQRQQQALQQVRYAAPPGGSTGNTAAGSMGGMNAALMLGDVPVGVARIDGSALGGSGAAGDELSSAVAWAAPPQPDLAIPLTDHFLLPGVKTQRGLWSTVRNATTTGSTSTPSSAGAQGATSPTSQPQGQKTSWGTALACDASHASALPLSAPIPVLGQPLGFSFSAWLVAPSFDGAATAAPAPAPAAGLPLQLPVLSVVIPPSAPAGAATAPTPQASSAPANAAAGLVQGQSRRRLRTVTRGPMLPEDAAQAQQQDSSAATTPTATTPAAATPSTNPGAADPASAAGTPFTDPTTAPNPNTSRFSATPGSHSQVAAGTMPGPSSVHMYFEGPAPSSPGPSSPGAAGSTAAAPALVILVSEPVAADAATTATTAAPTATTTRWLRAVLTLPPASASDLTHVAVVAAHGSSAAPAASQAAAPNSYRVYVGGEPMQAQLLEVNTSPDLSAAGSAAAAAAAGVPSWLLERLAANGSTYQPFVLSSSSINPQSMQAGADASLQQQILLCGPSASVPGAQAAHAAEQRRQLVQATSAAPAQASMPPAALITDLRLYAHALTAVELRTLHAAGPGDVTAPTGPFTMPGSDTSPSATGAQGGSSKGNTGGDGSFSAASFDEPDQSSAGPDAGSATSGLQGGSSNKTASDADKASGHKVTTVLPEDMAVEPVTPGSTVNAVNASTPASPAAADQSGVPADGGDLNTTESPAVHKGHEAVTQLPEDAAVEPGAAASPNVTATGPTTTTTSSSNGPGVTSSLKSQRNASSTTPNMTDPAEPASERGHAVDVVLPEDTASQQPTPTSTTGNTGLAQQGLGAGGVNSSHIVTAVLPEDLGTEQAAHPHTPTSGNSKRTLGIALGLSFGGIALVALLVGAVLTRRHLASRGASSRSDAAAAAAALPMSRLTPSVTARSSSVTAHHSVLINGSQPRSHSVTGAPTAASSASVTATSLCLPGLSKSMMGLLKPGSAGKGNSSGTGPDGSTTATTSTTLGRKPRHSRSGSAGGPAYDDAHEAFTTLDTVRGMRIMSETGQGQGQGGICPAAATLRTSTTSTSSTSSFSLSGAASCVKRPPKSSADGQPSPSPRTPKLTTSSGARTSGSGAVFGASGSQAKGPNSGPHTLPSPSTSAAAAAVGAAAAGLAQDPSFTGAAGCMQMLSAGLPAITRAQKAAQKGYVTAPEAPPTANTTTTSSNNNSHAQAKVTAHPLASFTPTSTTSSAAAHDSPSPQSLVASPPPASRTHAAAAASAAAADHFKSKLAGYPIHPTAAGPAPKGRGGGPATTTMGSTSPVFRRSAPGYSSQQAHAHASPTGSGAQQRVCTSPATDETGVVVGGGGGGNRHLTHRPSQVGGPRRTLE